MHSAVWSFLPKWDSSAYVEVSQLLLSYLSTTVSSSSLFVNNGQQRVHSCSRFTSPLKTWFIFLSPSYIFSSFEGIPDMTLGLSHKTSVTGHWHSAGTLFPLVDHTTYPEYNDSSALLSAFWSVMPCSEIWNRQHWWICGLLPVECSSVFKKFGIHGIVDLFHISDVALEFQTLHVASESDSLLR